MGREDVEKRAGKWIAGRQGNGLADGDRVHAHDFVDHSAASPANTRGAFKQVIVDLCRMVLERPLMIISVALMSSSVEAADYLDRNWPVVTGPYLGQEPPGMVAEIFAPGIVSTDKSEINSVFSPDGDEFYFTTWTREAGTMIVVTERVDDTWSVPKVASFSNHPTDVDPAISHDGKRVFFATRRPRPGATATREGGFDIWYADRTRNGWDEEQYLGPAVNSGKSQVYPTVTHDGTLYFQAIRDGGYGKADIYRSRLIDGVYQTPENIGPSVNSGNYEGDVFIAPDESYLIVSVSGREDSIGDADLYISFRERNDRWSPLKNMGANINSGKREFCPMLSPDGRYLFFTSKRRGEGDVYWVDAGVIEDLRDNTAADYFGLEPPGTAPRLFAPGLVTTEFADGGVGIGLDGDLFVFQHYENRQGRIFETVRQDGIWSSPQELPFSPSHKVGDFSIAPDGRTLFFQSNLASDEFGLGATGGNIWMATRGPDGWTDPTILGEAVNSRWHDSFPSAAADGSLYFFSRRPGGFGESDLYVSRRVGDRFEKAENLGPALNTAAHEWDPFVSPDQDYLIFCSTKDGGYGEDDLYIAFRQPDGAWSMPVNMGEPINSEGSENRPWVTPDGKFLFFASTRPGMGRSDVYWVDAGIISSYRTRQATAA